MRDKRPTNSIRLFLFLILAPFRPIVVIVRRVVVVICRVAIRGIVVVVAAGADVEKKGCEDQKEKQSK